jgi:AraC family transcriptional regulator, transcriptional activator of pobA
MEQKQDIPQYFVYGEPAKPLDVGFLHVELVSDRKNLHRGEVSAHKHPHMAQITFWTEGAGAYHIEDSSWTFSAPAISFVPSGVVHGFSVNGKADAIVVSISNDALSSHLEAGSPPDVAVFLPQKVFETSAWQDIATLIAMLRREYIEGKPFAAQTITQLVGAVLALIARGRNADQLTTNATQPLAQRLQRAIDINYREKRTVARYARELGVTYHTLDKAAQNAFGASIKQLIVQRRLLEAKRLLKFTIRSAEDISYELGFKDPAYFNRIFKTHTGRAPGLWRGS